MEIYEEFLHQLKKEASHRKVRIDTLWLIANKSDIVYNFINDLENGKVSTYTDADWDIVCNEVYKCHDLQNLFYREEVPYKIYEKFSNSMDEQFSLLRKDISENNIKENLKWLSTPELKMFIRDNGENIPARVKNHLATLPNEKLCELDYKPLSLINEHLDCFDNIQRNFETLYDDDEKAMTAIASNPHMSNKARMRAFEAGCEISKLENINTEIAKKIYELAIETLIHYESSTNDTTTTFVKMEIAKMIENDTLPYECQMDLAQRIKACEIEPYYSILTRTLASKSKYDSVLGTLCQIFSQQLISDISKNPYAGKESYEVFREKMRHMFAKASWFIEFLAHKQILSKDAYIEMYNIKDNQMCNVLCGFYGDVFYDEIPEREKEHSFYNDLGCLSKIKFPEGDRWEQIVKTMLDVNFHQSQIYIHDGNSANLEYNSFKHITSKINPLICISEEDNKKIKEICNTLSERYNIPEITIQINNFENHLKHLFKKEEFFRQNTKFFCETTNNKANDCYNFNIQYMKKASDNEISQLIKNINKIRDKELLKVLKANLIRDIAKEVKEYDNFFPMQAIGKFGPIHKAIIEREERLSRPINKVFEEFREKFNRSEDR